MRSPSRRGVLAAGGGLLAGLAGGYAARPHLDSDPPPDPAPLAWAATEWPYPDYDPQRTRNPPPESAPDGDLAVDWRREFEDGSERAPPVAANGRLFAASTDIVNSQLVAFALHSGEREWTRYGGNEPSHTLQILAPGDGVYYRFDQFEGSPLGLASAQSGEEAWGVADPPLGGWTVGAGRLYYGSRMDGKLHTYDARTGDKRWATSVDDEWLVVRAFHPDWGVFASSLDTLYALDPEDGSTRWDIPVDKHVRSGPVVAGQTAFVTTWGGDEHTLVALDATSGEELWTYPLSLSVVETEEGSAARWHDLGAAAGGTVLVRERHADPTPGALHAVDADSGDRLWRVEPPEDAKLFSKPAVVGDSVYVCTGDDRTDLQRRDLADGSVTGSWSLPGYCASPIVTDGRVLAQTPEELLAFA